MKSQDFNSINTFLNIVPYIFWGKEKGIVVHRVDDVGTLQHKWFHRGGGSNPHGLGR